MCSVFVGHWAHPARPSDRALIELRGMVIASIPSPSYYDRDWQWLLAMPSAMMILAMTDDDCWLLLWLAMIDYYLLTMTGCYDWCLWGLWLDRNSWLVFLPGYDNYRLTYNGRVVNDRKWLDYDWLATLLSYGLSAMNPRAVTHSLGPIHLPYRACPELCGYRFAE